MGLSAVYGPASELLASLTDEQYRRLGTDGIEDLLSLIEQEERTYRYDWTKHARPNQLEPQGDWSTWLMLAGRGFGKTRALCEFLRSRAESGRNKRIGIITPRIQDYRDVIVNGESGILAISPDETRPRWLEGKRLLRWNNGTQALCFTADKPEGLRGNQFDLLIFDELGSMRYGQEAWDMASFCLRLGENPQTVCATTPKPSKLIKELYNEWKANPNGDLRLSSGSTFDNKANIAKKQLDKWEKRYGGTELGRQELMGLILEEVKGALWRQVWIDETRHKGSEPKYSKVVVGVDPSQTSRGDVAGIVVAAESLSDKGSYYVLGDYSIQGSPNEWAQRAIDAYNDFDADYICYEANGGGEAYGTIFKSLDKDIPLKDRWASRDKSRRASPISALYQQGKVHHVGGLGDLESEITTWVPGSGMPSPGRLDALVWAVGEVAGKTRELKVF